MKLTKIRIDYVISQEGIGKSKIYNAFAIQIPNVITQGDTVEEATKMLKEALDLYFEEAPEERKKLIEIITINENNTPLISRMLV